MPSYLNIPVAIDTAKKLLAEKQALLAAIDSVRRDLRGVVTRKEGTDEERKFIADTFPVRRRTTKNKAA